MFVAQHVYLTLLSGTTVKPPLGDTIGIRRSASLKLVSLYKDYMSVLPAGTKEKCPVNRGDNYKDYMSVLSAGTKEKCPVNKKIPFIEIIITKI